MDASGIDMQVLSLTSPGVQVFDAATANALARDPANDELAEAIRKYPTRYTGLAAAAPQDPKAAAKEIERAVRKLGLRGVIMNSHTMGERLDDPKFWDIFAAAEALDVPIYLHPNAPPRDMIQPYLEKGLDGAVFGFQAETGLHMLRIIVSGVFDEFPKLKFVIGHCGEALPFWLYRIDYMHAAATRANRHPHMRKLKRTPGEYLRDNVYVTNSGVAWAPAIMLCHQVMGPDHTLYAMDYPYQYLPSEVTVSDNLPMSVGGQEEVLPDQRREALQDLSGDMSVDHRGAPLVPNDAQRAFERGLDLGDAAHDLRMRAARGGGNSGVVGRLRKIDVDVRRPSPQCHRDAR